jgi:hypothetical protein
MSAVTDIPDPVVPDQEAARPRSRRPWVVVLALLLVAALVAAAVVVARGSATSAQAAMLADQTITKSFQELERQAALPAGERSLEAFTWAIATPQSDRSGPVWSTDLGRADLGSPTMFAEVSAQLTASGQAPTYYLEFVVSTTSGPSTSIDTSVCLVRSGSPDAPLATAPYAVTDGLFVQPCSAELLQQRGIRT